MANKLGSGNDDVVVPINPNADARREQASNVSRGTYLEAVREIAAINAEMRSVNERRKSVRKKWKAEGIELGVLDATIKMAEWDRAEVRDHFDTARKYAQWLGLPVGAQGDLFKGLGEDEVQKKEWAALGAVASRLGKAARPPEECPPEYQQDWLRGFNEEDEALWTESEKADAQTAAAEKIDPEKPGNVGEVGEAMKAKPKTSMAARAKAREKDAGPAPAAEPEASEPDPDEVLH